MRAPGWRAEERVGRAQTPQGARNDKRFSGDDLTRKGASEFKGCCLCGKGVKSRMQPLGRNEERFSDRTCGHPKDVKDVRHAACTSNTVCRHSPQQQLDCLRREKTQPNSNRNAETWEENTVGERGKFGNPHWRVAEDEQTVPGAG